MSEGSIHKTTLVVDDDVIREAGAVLGTTGIKQTIDAALREVIRRQAVQHELEWLAHGDHDLRDEGVMSQAWR